MWFNTVYVELQSMFNNVYVESQSMWFNNVYVATINVV